MVNYNERKVEIFGKRIIFVIQSILLESIISRIFGHLVDELLRVVN